MAIKVKIMLTGLLLFVLLGAGDALAKPQWLKCSFTPSIAITGKNPNAHDYYSLKIVVRHANKSEDKIVKAIFDKKLEFSAVFNAGNKNECEVVLKSTKVNKMELYPGQTIKLTYIVPLSKLKGMKYVNWAMVNNIISGNGLRKINRVKGKDGKSLPNMWLVFDKRKYGYDCKVRTE
jgi:hypothetical protein